MGNHDSANFGTSPSIISKLKSRSLNLLSGETCNADFDCSKDGWRFCDQTTKQCVHKTLYPLKPVEIGGTLVLALMIALAVISGIGGGGIVVPLLMMFYHMSTKTAVAVSGFTIFLGSIVRFGTTMKQRHPDKDATSIDYSISNLMLPNVLLGSISGVFLNELLPELVLQICLFIVLSFLTWAAYGTSVKIYNKETKELDEIEKSLSQSLMEWNELTK